MSHDAPHRNYFSVIPSHVRDCLELENGAILLYGDIVSLTQVEGYCWASNEYLAKLNRVDTRTIQRWLQSLKAQKFIVIDLEKSGFHSTRKIWISEEVKKIRTRRQKCHPPTTILSPPHDKNVVPILKLIPSSKEEGEEGGKPPNPPSPPLFFERGKVKMEQSRHDELVKEFGASKVSETIEALEQYAAMKPKKFREYGCHAAVIRNWIKKDAKDQATKVSSKQSAVEADRKLAVDIKTKYPDTYRKGKIRLGSDYIEFDMGGASPAINLRFGDSGFRDQVLNRLRKMNLSIEGL